MSVVPDTGLQPVRTRPRDRYAGLVTRAVAFAATSDRAGDPFR